MQHGGTALVEQQRRAWIIFQKFSYVIVFLWRNVAVGEVISVCAI